MRLDPPSSFAPQFRQPAARGMRPQQEQRIPSGQPKQVFPSGPRSFRPRPNQPRYGTSTQDTNLSRSTTTTSEGELSPVNEAALEGLQNYHKEEQTIRNDLAIRYTVSGEWGGNHIKGANLEDTCREYPKLRRLMDLKREQVSELAHPPLHMTFDPINEPLMSLTKHLPIPFDVILIDPPPSYDWAKITSIPIRLISADPSFVFLWVGDAAGEGLERGRDALLKWGFRRCEEILWIKPNKNAIKQKKTAVEGEKDGDESQVKRWMQEGRKDRGDQPKNVMITQKEHCLMGIRGTVRRKTDNWFVHCNVDTDIMVWEKDEQDETAPRFPPQLYTIIENFCLGTRRLELFGPKSKARKGWVTLGEDDLISKGNNVSHSDSAQEYTPEKYNAILQTMVDEVGRNVLPQVEEIEAIRPKSPTRGERPGSTLAPPRQSTPSVHSGPGANPNHSHLSTAGNRQSFRPPRFPLQGQPPNWTDLRNMAHPGMPSPFWRPSMPPRMYPPQAAFGAPMAPFEMNNMRAEVEGMETGFMDPAGIDSTRRVAVPQIPTGTPDAYPSYVNQFYPPPPPHIFPQSQQYPSNFNKEPYRTGLGASDQQFIPRFEGNSNQQPHVTPPSRTKPQNHMVQQSYMSQRSYPTMQPYMAQQPNFNQHLYPLSAGPPENYNGYSNGPFLDNSGRGHYHPQDTVYRNPPGGHHMSYHSQQHL